ncbi:MAG TPA: helix-hairpin-helix domain-containing protein [Pirellulaceae bacterium]|nr:helix-hairpin-helix domain-containing protein [Pirellulaceae bacterium]HMO91466.1 helix-hairpin-helix domain-containing protein [Pirellulaceae bacterium]HMP69457.1 helix-hairpin-helix domain-containing protein [Pirellulaceae bacterium]
MHPSKVNRRQVKCWTDLPNVGKATALVLKQLGIQEPSDLVGKDPFDMFSELCRITGQIHDPCVIDVFMSITRYMSGDQPRAWWEYTAERKRILASGNQTAKDLVRPKKKK